MRGGMRGEDHSILILACSCRFKANLELTTYIWAGKRNSETIKIPNKANIAGIVSTSGTHVGQSARV